nr:tail fiber protein [Clostridium kluyveri]
MKPYFPYLVSNYGDDNKTTFALPNLKGAEPLSTMRYFIVTEGIYLERQ